MAAFESLLYPRDNQEHYLVKRSNWASRNVGPVLVFCILFVVGSGLLSLFIYRKIKASKAGRDPFAV